MRFTHNIQKQEQGFASMVVALTVVIILALVTVGFAQLTRREQQNALNKQLATQANYAAEAGINDAIKYIHENPGYTNPNPTQCINDLPQTATSGGYKPAIDTTNGVSYTCLLIDTKPKSLQFSNVAPRADELVTFSTTTAPDPLTIEWDSSRSNAPPNTGSKFPTTTTWNTNQWPAVLQVDITDLGNGFVDRASLMGNAFTTYLYPTTVAAPGSAVFRATQGAIIPASCVPQGGGMHCKAQITGMTAGGYLLHILNLYDTSNTITITGGNSPNLVQFIDGQAMIDVTGKARDVLKRLRVRVCLSANNCHAPLPGTEAQNICKRQETRPGNTDFRDMNNTITSNVNNPCYLGS